MITQKILKERPILFSGPMVKAILEGCKTQTRRIIKGVNENPVLNKVSWQKDGWYWDEGNGCFFNIQCPYGQPGDRLWVRETWALNNGKPCYRAGEFINGNPLYPIMPKGSWKPSIHMKRADSRIDLEVVKVRVERLQDISEEDSLAEGVEALRGQFEGAFSAGKNALSGTTAKECYERLWNEINGPENWNANPWVWVVEFKRIRP